MQLTTEIHNGKIYYIVENHGVKYSLSYIESTESWGLTSRRKSLSYRRAGCVPGFRYFKTLKELENSLKCFQGISYLIYSGGEKNTAIQ